MFDVPALAPLVAERMGVPSFALTNFTWQYIYEPQIPELPALARFCALHDEAYAKVKPPPNSDQALSLTLSLLRPAYS